MIASRKIPLLATAFLSMAMSVAASPAAGTDPAAASPAPASAPADVRIGVPGGITLDAFAHPGNGDVYVFVRFAEPRPGDVTVTIRDADGVDVASRTAALEHGSAMLLWDRAIDGGGVAAAGEYAAHLMVDGREHTTAFTLD